MKPFCSDYMRKIYQETETSAILARKRESGLPLAFPCLSRQRHSTLFNNNDEMIAQLAVMGGGSGGNGGGSRVSRGGLTLHRSNSSLELPHSPERSGRVTDAQPLRREYGSHGSIDVVAGQCNPAGGNTTGEHIFAMLQDFRSGRSSADRLYPHPHHHHHHHQHAAGLDSSILNAGGASTDEVCGPTSASSPKVRLKINRLWGGKESPPTGVSTPATVVSSDLEERHRRRAFVHYDTQSLTANLGYAAKLRGILLARRRNTATGASAASTIRAPTPDNDSPEGNEVADDPGDGKSNDLLESCPFFRNEIGGEGEREVALARSPSPTVGAHRPSLSYGVSVLEPMPGETLWKHTCPLRKRLLPIESVDEGARYYRKYFFGKEHQNWFGMDEQLGPVAISIRRDGNHYRIIVRTSELLTLRGSIPEEALGLRTNQGSRIPTREILELVAPEVQLGCLRLGTPAAEETLARLDEQGLSNRYKVGVLYCRAGQRTEEEMYNNQHAGPAFLEFLDTVGQRVKLRGFEGYKAGLDTRTDSTGTHAVAATHRGSQLTFHVVTMLPFTPNNRQQLLRKRHIGNDIVTIVFQEPGALPFSPRRIRSQFQHVFIIVRAINPCTDNTQYSVAVSRSKEVSIFGPPVPSGATFNKGKSFADFILAKVINAENAAHRSEKFSTMATRTRQEYLKDLAINYSTTTIIDTGQKFSMLSFSSKKKVPVRPRLACDASQRGAICWQVILEESNQNTDCYLGISVDTIVLIEEHSRQTVFVSPCINVLGWHAQTNSLRLYYHQGECISIHVRPDYSERDEIMEIVARLRAVTQGSPASELSLKRNSLGQLGFHVQPDGVVTQVEPVGLSWQAGLRQGSRLVEICKVAVSTLSHDQMVDLLKTSAQVTVTVIPPTNDGQPRRGCSLQSCQYLSTNYESDYENVSSENVPSQQMAQQVHQTKNYERSTSPPRSSNSSGYGTGSSSRSFNDPRFIQETTSLSVNNVNTNASCSTSASGGGSTAAASTSGNTSSSHNTDERWYDLFEAPEQDASHRIDGTPPPPLPARQKERNELHGKSTTDQLKHHHDYYSKESNYVSPRVIQESNYQRLDDANRSNTNNSSSNSNNSNNNSNNNNNNNNNNSNNNNSQEDPAANYARIQKDHGYWYGSNSGHQKQSPSSSLPLNHQNSGYSSKPMAPSNGIRYNEQVNGNELSTVYDNEPSRVLRKPKNDFETRASEWDRGGSGVATGIVKNENYQESRPVDNLSNESNSKYRDRQVSSYDFVANDYDRKKNNHNDNIINNSTSDVNRIKTGLNYDVNLSQRDDSINNSSTSTIREPTHEFIIGEKVTCIKSNLPERVLSRKLAHEYMRKDYTSSSLPPEVRIFDGNNSTSLTTTTIITASDIPTMPSEDELPLNACENSSPAFRRTGKHRPGSGTSSGASSSTSVAGVSNSSPRNQSPRPKSIVRNQIRNSANLTSSTLQEDLMKLINPDFIADDNTGSASSNNSNIIISDDNYIVNGNNSENKISNLIDKNNDIIKIVSSNNVIINNNNNNEVEIQNKCRSRENLCGSSTTTLSVLTSSTRQDNNCNTNVNAGSEVILTKARPATVISNTSTNTSPALSESKMTKEERLSPRVTKTHVPLKSTNNSTSVGRDCKNNNAGDGDDNDLWAANNNYDVSKRFVKHNNLDRSDEKIYESTGNITNTGSNNSVIDLQGHLSNLELRVARETRRRLSLEDEVRRLRDENRRLQDENHAAAQQLRRFTEWFFQTIDHQ
ncbi:signal-induced proliferation-associated 1-like protein 1 isoform X2 [Microplitis demolitor]|uniref:signal-induced proliferation-associated 1-like protein 1 isoform X2 n=1 Tax=Microplitis demolitor TaxID=69319 RepID=UPI0004CDD8F8|nr:signal-induced proliferation-associated 1-like protein 1 isoform X2 [Microplitis demolitor]XP_053593152.1 signal-induced proliferation-associated 1-like protein 1 isoform X2 [Microplitis demolitor]